MSVVVQARYRSIARVRIGDLRGERRAPCIDEFVTRLVATFNLEPSFEWQCTEEDNVILKVTFIVKDSAHAIAEQRAWSMIKRAIVADQHDVIVCERRDLEVITLESVNA